MIFLHKLINLFILFFTGNIQSTSSAALSPENTISLYNSSDKVTVLVSQNFSSTVYQSKTAWLIEFYASWCGHCQSYANIYREVGIDTWTWNTVVRIAAINCHGTENYALCRQHNIPGYPTIRLIPPESVFDANTSKAITVPATDAKYVEIELIKELDNMHKRYKSWPYFTPVNRVTFEELYARIPSTVKLLFVIVEKREDFTGRQIMLDFSKYSQQIAIFRTTTDGMLWRKFHINLTDVPALFIILRNRTAERINTKQNISNSGANRNLFNYAIRSYIHKTNSIPNFNNDDLKELISSRNALINTEKDRKLVQNQNIPDDIIDKNTIHLKVNMVDLELALSHMFREEIPHMKSIKGERYDALVQWLTILTKYFPGREPVIIYLNRLLSKIHEQSNGFSGEKFREMVDMKTSLGYLPNDYKQYQHCAGSEPKYRGYPCALWLLFHTLTISQYHQGIESQQIDAMEIPLAIKNYVKYFFTCRQCSDNFMNETSNIDQLKSKNKHEAIIYLWKIHNHVNKRLHGEITEDPQHPKVQFPSKSLCPTCQSVNNNEHDVSKTVNFLLDYYSKPNIDTSLLLKKSQLNSDLVKQPEHIISKVESNNDTKQSFGLFRYSTTILQGYSTYVLFALFIVLVLCRRRYCKAKGKRYTV